MKKLGLIAFVSLFFAACNNTANETKTTDSTSIQNNTNVIKPAPPDSNMLKDTNKLKDSNNKNR